jgi:hypothetical protein
MWFRRRRRRQSPPPVLLPALDRLAELVERVVALLDEVAVTAPPPDLPRPPEPPSVRSDLVPAAADGWVAFVASPAGYRLVEREGAAPARGEVVELDGAGFRVLRLGPSPLPGDARRCAFVEREEPPAEARSFEP